MKVFNMPHPLWHRSSIYDGHLQGPVTLAPVADRLAVELSLPVFNYSVRSVATGNRTPTCEDFRFKEALGFADITTWFSIKGFTYCIIYKVLCTAYIFRIHGEFLGTPLKYIFKVMSFICLWLPWFPLFNIIISQTF